MNDVTLIPILNHVYLAILARMQDVEKIMEDLSTYQRARISEKDYHGSWDVAIDLSRYKAEKKGLQFAMDCITREIG